MPYRERLKAEAAKNPQEFLSIWRQERSFRVGTALVYAGLFLSLIATVVDFIYSTTVVFLTDLVLVTGCALTLYWTRRPTRPSYFWVPLFIAYWVSSIPSYWSTGGIHSPFFGVGLAGLYIMGTVVDAKDRSLLYLVLTFVHIPIFWLIEIFYPLAPSQPPTIFTALITSLLLATIIVCVRSLLRTERELAAEFSDHYHNLVKTEADLLKREGQLREAQTIANIGSWEWDIESDVVAWSDELHRIFEVPKENFDPSFKAYLSRFDPERRKRIEKIIQDSIKAGEDFTMENTIRNSRGERSLFSRGRVLRNSDGKVVGMRGTSQDITDRKQIESELMLARRELEMRVEERTQQLAHSLERERAAKELAENASQAKMQFLANMSHEIRTPMNAILGFSDLLASDSHSPEQFNEYLARIRANGQQLLHLIDDILDLSKFEAGRIPIQKGVFSPKSLVEDAVSSFTPVARAKGLSLDLQVSESLPVLIYTDAARVRQVLTNLLSNAVKFSSTGSIQISLTSRTHPDHTILTFDVRDSGIGISVEGQKNLFKAFSQGDTSTARKYGGSGLGLALSKLIAEALDGDLMLKLSAPGQGTHFSFEIPVEEALPDAIGVARPRSEDPRILRGLKVLLAEDSGDNALLITHYVKSLGGHIEVVADGANAVTSVQTNNYDLVLMDIQMPGMDGLEATRQIRRAGYELPIIALTAHALPAEAQRSLEAGCDLHLTKPISKSDLANALVIQLDKRRLRSDAT